MICFLGKVIGLFILNIFLYSKFFEFIVGKEFLTPYDSVIVLLLGSLILLHFEIRWLISTKIDKTTAVTAVLIYLATIVYYFVCMCFSIIDLSHAATAAIVLLVIKVVFILLQSINTNNTIITMEE